MATVERRGISGARYVTRGDQKGVIDVCINPNRSIAELWSLQASSENNGKGSVEFNPLRPKVSTFDNIPADRQSRQLSNRVHCLPIRLLLPYLPRFRSLSGYSTTRIHGLRDDEYVWPPVARLVMDKRQLRFNVAKARRGGHVSSDYP